MRYILLAYAFVVLFLIQSLERPKTTTLVRVEQKFNHDLRCLADNIYHEARGESHIGQIAVAQVTINRARLQKTSICAIVYQKNQFSWVGKVKEPNRASALWKRIENIAHQALEGKQSLQGLKHATHFHTIDVYPLWADTKRFIMEIGRHRFYA
jgi:N-acetylmuramoyl-L-alanine amidase